MQKKPRRKYVAQEEFDEEKIESDDNSQFKVVSHNPLSDLENLCKNIKNSVDLLGFTHVDFGNLGKIEKNQVEEAIYAMMEKFKTTPLKIANSMPKSWPKMRQIREASLAQVIPELTKAHIAKAMKKYIVRFVPKYKALKILQNNVEDVVKKSTQTWKVTYGLTTLKEGKKEPIEVKDDEEDNKNDDIVGGWIEMNIDYKAIVDLEQQEEE